MKETDIQSLGILLFPRFELLDVFGPAEMFGVLRDRVRLIMVAEEAGPVASNQGPRVVADADLDDCPALDMLLVPGGMGTREDVNNRKLLDWLAERGHDTPLIMSVCTGTALLAQAGLLEGRPATTNKRSFQWVTEQGPAVEWVREARWVDDGDRVTSSGVSAGMDMALHVIEREFGAETAEAVAAGTEYEWHRDAAWDPFAKLYEP